MVTGRAPACHLHLLSVGAGDGQTWTAVVTQPGKVDRVGEIEQRLTFGQGFIASGGRFVFLVSPAQDRPIQASLF